MDCIVHGVAESDTTEWLSHHFLLFLQPQIHANIQWSVRDALILRTYHWGTSLVAQLLRLCASNAERGLDWSLAEELKIPHAAWGSQKAETKTYHWNLWSPPSDTSNAPHWINTYGMQNTDTPSMFKERWPMDCSLPGSSVPGILQARTLESVAMPSPGDFPDPGSKPGSPALQADSLPSEPWWKPKNTRQGWLSPLQQIFPSLGTKPTSPAIASGFFIPESPGKPFSLCGQLLNICQHPAA